MRGAWTVGLGLGLGLAAGWSCTAGGFTCGDDAACQDGSVPGVCVEGHCAFPDDDCASGLQYGAHADELTGTCVPEDADSVGPTSGPSSDSATTGVTTGATTGVTSGQVDTSTTETGVDTSGEPPDNEVEFTDDDTADFTAGGFEGTEWADGRLLLLPGTGSGIFISRVFDAGAPAQWHTAQWQPDGPYGKPLPDGGAAEGDYETGAIDMSGNVLLMHFDGNGGLSDGEEVLDVSGAGSHGTLVSDAGPVPLVPGVFGEAMDDHASSRVSIPTDRAPGLSFGTSDFTWSLWFRMNDPCTQNHVYMGVDNAEGMDFGPHLWLGCTDDQWDECPGMVSAPRLGGVLRSEHSTPDDGGFFCGSSDVDGNRWHNAVVVKQGHEMGQILLYLDGRLEYAGPASFAGSNDYPDAPDFTIGAFSRGTYPADGVFDEAAVWTRALSEDEAEAVYLRGSLQLVLVVRVCNEPDCSDDPPFTGELRDPPQGLAPGAELPLRGLPVGRYVQYAVGMSRMDEAADPSPMLGSVTLRGTI